MNRKKSRVHGRVYPQNSTQADEDIQSQPTSSQTAAAAADKKKWSEANKKLLPGRKDAEKITCQKREAKKIAWLKEQKKLPAKKKIPAKKKTKLPIKK